MSFLLIIISVWTEKLVLNCKQIDELMTLVVLVVRELLYLSITLPRVLNADSDATVE